MPEEAFMSTPRYYSHPSEDSCGVRAMLGPLRIDSHAQNLKKIENHGFHENRPHMMNFP